VGVSVCDVGILIPDAVTGNRRKMLVHLANSVMAREDAMVMRHYRPCKTLLLYGWGGDVQQKAVKRHQGNYACFDLGYWCKTGAGDRHWRISINNWHSPERIMWGHDPSPHRFETYGFKVAERGGNPDGPVLLIGNTAKSSRIGAANWTRKKCWELRRATKKPIWLKVKPNRRPEVNVGEDQRVYGDIFDVLPDVSLVVCRHSNVAVDATLAGVPVVCDDGAGAAIYPSKLEDAGLQPSYEDRLRFLHRLAYWQWSTNEIRTGECWRWLKRELQN
jgi:hypothetical protein